MILSTNGVTGSGSTIGDLLKNRFGKKLKKSDFTINRPQTLFGPDWSQLKSGRCPHCTNKLYMMKKNPNLFICKSKKHKKSFVINTTSVQKIVDSI